MEGFGRVRGKGRIRASTETLSERVPKNGRIRISTGKWKDSGEYRDKVESVRVSKNCPNEYRKMVESGSIPENDGIRASTEKLSERVPKEVESGLVPLLEIGRAHV